MIQKNSRKGFRFTRRPTDITNLCFLFDALSRGCAYSYIFFLHIVRVANGAFIPYPSRLVSLWENHCCSPIRLKAKPREYDDGDVTEGGFERNVEDLFSPLSAPEFALHDADSMVPGTVDNAAAAASELKRWEGAYQERQEDSTTDDSFSSQNVFDTINLSAGSMQFDNPSFDLSSSPELAPRSDSSKDLDKSPDAVKPTAELNILDYADQESSVFLDGSEYAQSTEHVRADGSLIQESPDDSMKEKLTEVALDLLTTPDIPPNVDDNDVAVEDEEGWLRMLSARRNNMERDTAKERELYEQVFADEEGYKQQSEIFRKALSGDEQAAKQAAAYRRSAAWRRQQDEGMRALEKEMESFERQLEDQEQETFDEGTSHDKKKQKSPRKCPLCGYPLFPEDISRSHQNGLCQICYAEKLAAESPPVQRAPPPEDDNYPVSDALRKRMQKQKQTAANRGQVKSTSPAFTKNLSKERPPAISPGIRRKPKSTKGSLDSKRIRTKPQEFRESDMNSLLGHIKSLEYQNQVHEEQVRDQFDSSRLDDEIINEVLSGE